MSKYLMVLLFSLAIPLVLAFFPPVRLQRKLKPLFFSIGLIVLIFGFWDVYATFRGHWSFDQKAIIGVNILNLPLEEWLFFIVIPFCSIFSWEAILFFKRKLP